MNFNNEKEIRKEKYLGGGTFGSVYQYGDCAIKLYHDLVKTDIGKLVQNPCLKRQKKLNLLLQKKEEVSRSNLISDLLFINGKLKGVCYPFYDGDTLINMIASTTFEQKQDISHQLIDNTKELNHYFIYPLDSKLDNILYDGKTIKIIDLDDVSTKVTYGWNPIYLEKSLKSLRGTFTNIFCGDKYIFENNLLSLLESYQKQKDFLDNSFISYQNLNQFISNRSIDKKLIFINPKCLSQFDMEKIKRIIEFTDSKIVLMFSHNKSYLLRNDIDSYINTIKIFQQLGISIYDVIFQKQNDLKNKKIIECLNNYNTTGYYIFDEENIFEQFKGHQSLENSELDFCINTLNSKKLIKK